MDIMEYERELEEKIEELRNEIDSLREEKLATPEYEEDIQADIRNCLAAAPCSCISPVGEWSQPLPLTGAADAQVQA